MSPLVPVSWGELFDKITILEIKAERLTAAPARANVAQELALLSAVPVPAAFDDEARSVVAALRVINRRLWEYETRVRSHERRKAFDPLFVELGRSIVRNNDERARLKRQLNVKLESEIVEEKQY